MKKILIGAVAENGLYGYGRGSAGRIPWRSKEDMKFFRETTTPHAIAMGRGTWDSIPAKFRPFTNRTNYIITNNLSFGLSQADRDSGVQVFNSVSSVDAAVSTEKVFWIGSSNIWYNVVHDADELLINRIGLSPSIAEELQPVFFHALLDPTQYFEGFVQAGDPNILVENKDTPEEFTVSCYRYTRK